jgi:hypothetical protein
MTEIHPKNEGSLARECRSLKSSMLIGVIHPEYILLKIVPVTVSSILMGGFSQFGYPTQHSLVQNLGTRWREQ